MSIEVRPFSEFGHSAGLSIMSCVEPRILCLGTTALYSERLYKDTQLIMPTQRT